MRGGVDKRTRELPIAGELCFEIGFLSIVQR